MASNGYTRKTEFTPPNVTTFSNEIPESKWSSSNGIMHRSGDHIIAYHHYYWRDTLNGGAVSRRQSTPPIMPQFWALPPLSVRYLNRKSGLSVSSYAKVKTKASDITTANYEITRSANWFLEGIVRRIQVFFLYISPLALVRYLTRTATSQRPMQPELEPCVQSDQLRP